MNKAYLVWVEGEELKSIVPALNRNDARRTLFLAAKSAGWKMTWLEIRAVRRPDLDEWAASAGKFPHDSKSLGGDR